MVQDENGLVRWNQPLKLYTALCPTDGVATHFEAKSVRVALLMYCGAARGLRLATHDLNLAEYSTLQGHEKRSQIHVDMQPTAELLAAAVKCAPDLSHCIDVPAEGAQLCQVLDDDEPEEEERHTDGPAIALASHMSTKATRAQSERPRNTTDAALARAQSQAEEFFPCADPSKWHHRLRCEEAACSRSFWFGGRHHCRRCGVSVCSKHFSRPLCVRCARKTI